MPPLVAAVGAYLGSLTIGTLITGALTSLASSLIMSGLQKLIAGKPKTSGSSLQNSGITQQVRQAIIIRKPVYGELRRSGGVLFIAVTNNNKYLHMIIEVAPHEIEDIGEVWLNDYSIPPDHLDADGVVTEGRYKDKVRIRKYLGTASQSADSFLVAECSQWTTAHRLRGIAYMYIRLQWDKDIFPTGVPNASAWVKGKKVYDPRTTMTAYSVNPALILNDYLQDPAYGLGALNTEVDETYTIASANVCDEVIGTTDYSVNTSAVDATKDTLTLVGDSLYFQRGDTINFTTTNTLPAGLSLATDYYAIPYQRKTTCRIKVAATYADAMEGIAIDLTDAGVGTHTVTKTAEPRYSGSFVIDTESAHDENIKDILAGMVGFNTYSGGVHKMIAGSYQTPTVYFNENNIVSAISVQTKISTRERFNTVRGVYVSPINDGEASDYPQVTNSTYIAEDGEELVKQIDMTLTQRPHTAQRIAKISLELMRQEITWSADFDLSAMQVIGGDNAYFTFAKYGWNNKVFQIKNWRFEIRNDNDTARPVIRMELREIAAACYDWNAGEETSVDPAPNTELPDPFTVAAVTGLGISSEFVETSQGDTVFKILMQWTLSSDEFVYNGGFYEIEYKRSADSIYRQTYTVTGQASFAEVTLAAQLNEDYDIRIRAVNSLGVRSGYTSILGYLVGTSGGVGTTEDWGLASSGVTTTEDWGLVSSGVTTTEDWGYTT